MKGDAQPLIKFLIDNMIYTESELEHLQKQRILNYMYFGVYRQFEGFHLVGFYFDSNPFGKAEKAFFTPHFFDRYKEQQDSQWIC